MLVQSVAVDSNCLLQQSNWSRD